MKIEVEKNVTLEAEKRSLKEMLASKEEIIKVLTDGSDRINNSREKGATIRQLQKDVAKLTQQQRQEKSSEARQATRNGSKRKHNASDETISKMKPPRVVSISTPRSSPPPLVELLHKMKFDIESFPRSAIAIVNATNVVIISVNKVVGGDALGGESLVINTVSSKTSVARLDSSF